MLIGAYNARRIWSSRVLLRTRALKGAIVQATVTHNFEQPIIVGCNRKAVCPEKSHLI